MRRLAMSDNAAWGLRWVAFGNGHREAVRIDGFDAIRFTRARWAVAQVEREDRVGFDVHGERKDVPVVLGDRHRRNEVRWRLIERTRYGTIHPIDAVGDRVRGEVSTLGKVAAYFVEDRW